MYRVDMNTHIYTYGFGGSFGRGAANLTNRESCGGWSNYGPFLGTLNIRCRIKIGTQKGTIILTTAHVLWRGYAGRRVYIDVVLGFSQMLCWDV